MNSCARITCALLAAALLGCQNGPEQQDDPTDSPVKLGFSLDAETIAALNGYTVRTEPAAPSASSGVAGRRFHAFDGTRRLFLQVAVSQRPPGDQTPAALLKEWLADDPGVSVPFESVWTEAQLVGEATFVHPLAPKGRAVLGLAFARKNILVQVWESADLTPGPGGGLAGLDTLTDLLPVALELDAKIQALPNVTFEALKAERPRIETFAAASKLAGPDTEVGVTFKASYPSGRPEKPWFSFGIVETEGGGLAFKRDDEGLHEERAVAIDGRLLHAEATIEVRVRAN